MAYRETEQRNGKPFWRPNRLYPVTTNAGYRTAFYGPCCAYPLGREVAIGIAYPPLNDCINMQKQSKTAQECINTELTD